MHGGVDPSGQTVFVVEFRSRITGETWRETVYFPLEPNEPEQCGIGFHQRLDK